MTNFSRASKLLMHDSGTHVIASSMACCKIVITINMSNLFEDVDCTKTEKKIKIHAYS